MGVITFFRTVFRLPARRDQASLRIQYLGKRGLTYPCVQAMATILTSPYPCSEITVVFQEQARGEDHTAVCFVIWDWLDYGITIVPDGFGTHNGTGGWGLGVVLALIQFFQVPLKEKWVEADQFERIANGYPTPRDCEQLHQADHWAPSWPAHLHDYERRGHVLWTDLPRELSQFPYWVIEPELLGDVKDIERNPGLAVFQAARRLEMVVRSFGPYDARLTGEPLVNEAMGTGRPFEPHGATPNERLAWTHLFRGAVGAIRNPEGHRDQQLSLEDAIGQILAVNMLLRKLKADFPDHFRQAAPSSGADEDEQEREEEEQAASPAHTERS
jgi:hypothetical protein